MKAGELKSRTQCDLQAVMIRWAMNKDNEYSFTQCLREQVATYNKAGEGQELVLCRLVDMPPPTFIVVED